MNKSNMFLLTTLLETIFVGCGGYTADKVKDKTVDKVVDKTKDVTDKTKDAVKETTDTAKEKTVDKVIDDKKPNKCIVKDGKVHVSKKVCTYSYNGGLSLGLYCTESGFVRSTAKFSEDIISSMTGGTEFTCEK